MENEYLEQTKSHTVIGRACFGEKRTVPRNNDAFSSFKQDH